MISGGKRKAMMIAAIKGEEDFANLEKAIVTRTLIVRALWFVDVITALGGDGDNCAAVRLLWKTLMILSQSLND